jgi:Rad51
MENGIALICGAEIPSSLIFKPIAQLAGSGRPVYVVDGDNSFRSYHIARYARDLKLDPRLALAQVQVSRAFTCYQLVEIIERLSRRANTINCSGIVCLGLLGTLYDEDVAWPEAQRLLREVIAHLKLLAERRPVIVTVRPPSSKAQNRLGLIQLLMQQVDVVRILEPDLRYPRTVQIPLRLSSGK